MTQDATATKSPEKYPKRIVLGRGIPSRSEYGTYLHTPPKEGSYGELQKTRAVIPAEYDKAWPEYDLVLIRVAKPKKKKQGISG